MRLLSGASASRLPSPLPLPFPRARPGCAARPSSASAFRAASSSAAPVGDGGARKPWLFVGLGNPGKLYKRTRHNFTPAAQGRARPAQPQKDVRAVQPRRRTPRVSRTPALKASSAERSSPSVVAFAAGPSASAAVPGTGSSSVRATVSSRTRAMVMAGW